MLVPVDREGFFRVEIQAYTLKEMESGAIAIQIRARLLEWYGVMEQGDEPGWHDWTAYNMMADGDIWIVSGKEKGNKINQSAVESLMRYADWNGDVLSIANEQWTPSKCAVTIKPDTDKNGNIKPNVFRIAFVNDYNRTPGEMKKIAPDAAASISSRYGAQLRAIAGNVKRNGAPPADRPSPPPVAAATQDQYGNDIPF